MWLTTWDDPNVAVPLAWWSFSRLWYYITRRCWAPDGIMGSDHTVIELKTSSCDLGRNCTCSIGMFESVSFHNARTRRVIGPTFGSLKLSKCTLLTNLSNTLPFLEHCQPKSLIYKNADWICLTVSGAYSPKYSLATHHRCHIGSLVSYFIQIHFWSDLYTMLLLCAGMSFSDSKNLSLERPIFHVTYIPEFVLHERL